MTFLKKLGGVLISLAGVAAGFGPLVKPFLGSGAPGTVAAVNDLTSIGQVIVQIETAFAAVPGSTGAQKMQGALPLIANIVKTSELVVGKKIADDVLFTKACQELAQGMVDLLQSIHPDEVKKA